MYETNKVLETFDKNELEIIIEVYDYFGSNKLMTIEKFYELMIKHKTIDNEQTLKYIEDIYKINKQIIDQYIPSVNDKQIYVSKCDNIIYDKIYIQAYDKAYKQIYTKCYNDIYNDINNKFIKQSKVKTSLIDSNAKASKSNKINSSDNDDDYSGSDDERYKNIHGKNSDYFYKKINYEDSDDFYKNINPANKTDNCYKCYGPPHGLLYSSNIAVTEKKPLDDTNFKEMYVSTNRTDNFS